jgi:uncharacterized protein (DUF58 family)
VLTGTGRTFVALAVVLTVAGFVLRYPSLVALGIAFLVALVVAVGWVLRRPRVRAVRVLRPERVEVGNPAISELRITNVGRRRTTGSVALEQFGDRLLPVEVPALEPEETALITQALPTDRRGVYQVGPLQVSRSDPFSLIRIGQQQEDVTTFYVHPRIIAMSPLPSGVHRDLEGSNLGEAPEGGIAFQNLREYVEGDDLRLVHWRSYAKTGTLMVRHNVDTHQPRSVIILDTRASVYNDQSFEDAVEVAASIAAASIHNRFPFRLETSDGLSISSSMSRAAVFDALAGLRPMPIGTVQRAIGRVSKDPGGASLSVVSGRCTSADLAGLAPLRKRFAAMTIGRIGVRAGGEVVLAPGSVLINALSSTDFARSWNRRAR